MSGHNLRLHLQKGKLLNFPSYYRLLEYFLLAARPLTSKRSSLAECSRYAIKDGILHPCDKTVYNQKTLALEELYNILIKPVRNLLKGEWQLCIIPDEALCYLPFGALLSVETKQYMVEEFAISEAPTTKIFLVCTEIARAKSGSRRESLLGIGDPHFDKSRFPGLDPLASAQDEVRGNSAPLSWP